MILIKKQVWWNCKNRGMANIHIQRSLEIDNQVICEISIHKEICALLLLMEVYL